MLESLVTNTQAQAALIQGSDLTILRVNPVYQAIIPDRKFVGKTLDEACSETMPLIGECCRHVLETGEA